jgi:hypothetical protein
MNKTLPIVMAIRVFIIDILDPKDHKKREAKLPF